jgi:polar amino acid transport system substrate-binding protein
MKCLKILLLSILLAACEKKESEHILVVGTSADNPPYEFIQKSEIVGIDIDIINEIGKHLNKKVVIKNFDFNGLLAALVSENVDVVIAALSVTPERKEYISFSDNYGSTNLAVLHRAEDNIQTIDDLNDKVIGVQLGSAWEKTAQELAQKMNIKIHSLSNNLMLVEELKAKVVDAVILEELQCAKFKENNANLASCNLENLSSELAIAMSKNSSLIKEINESIKALNKEGTINKIMKKWSAQ